MFNKTENDQMKDAYYVTINRSNSRAAEPMVK